MARKPMALGNFNCYTAMSATIVRTKKTVIYNGTTLDLCKQLLAAGAKDGDAIKTGEKTRRFFAAPHDTRCGFWITEWNMQY